MSKLFNLHTHKFTNQENILELVNQYPWEFDDSVPFYSIGIHPWYIDESRLSSDLQIIDKELSHQNCLALGECGLDKRIEIPIEIQEKVFKAQILLAEKHQKPLVLHCVAAFQEIIQIKKEQNVTVPMIIHGFSKNEQTAKQLLDNGFYLSFGKYLLRNPELKSVFQSVPNDRFFLETDTIEESLEEVYALGANYKNIEIEELKSLIKTNFDKVFHRNL
ncbi:TatD family hydrolase [Flavobacterium azooxidireducens]|uniref:TatD family hydrolase n=1 Tax=Flavobacterium azooxidireducens TaxID=1871076 RepID=A0ABY4KE41_9FLAO|nr:TatD family hydrolase [Flavobacterium azooxidireducens]UPQ79070.1 TatD family hydrolase [Flavobacterium azooxidireducens]